MTDGLVGTGITVRTAGRAVVEGLDLRVPAGRLARLTLPSAGNASVLLAALAGLLLVALAVLARRRRR